MSVLRLLAWLGPWMRQDKSPKGIAMHELKAESGPIQIYSSAKTNLGPLFIIPGLHPEGPADPRVDRFCRVMAHAGYIVGAPHLKAMTECRMSPELCEDSLVAFEAFSDHVQSPSAIFSISAASIAALTIGANDRWVDKISKIMLFGGFIDWQEAMTYALTGKTATGRTGSYDPLNLPVVFLNLVHLSPNPPTDIPRFRAALKAFIDRCWEKENFKTIAEFGPVASQLAERLPEKDKAMFLKATRLRPGGVEMALEIAQRDHAEHEWLNPVPLLAKQNRPLLLIHGKEDVVVPWTQSIEIANAMPQNIPTKRHVTGFYTHTGTVTFWRLLGILPLIPIEIWTSIRVVLAMAKLNQTNHVHENT